jgi:phosphoglycolate phosphatase
MTDRSIMRKVLVGLGINPIEIESKLDTLFKVMLTFFASELAKDDHNDYIALPGAVELLEQLRAKNIACGLATGNYCQFAQWKLNSTGLNGYFTFGGYGEDADERWQIVQIALSRSGIINGDLACHFGDTVADIKAAAKNGMLSVGITADGGGKFSRDVLASADADLILDSYFETDRIFELLGI